MENNENDNQKNKSQYQDSAGTGVIGAIIFLIFAIIGMYLLSKYL